MAGRLLACLAAAFLSTLCLGHVSAARGCPSSWAQFQGRCYKYFPQRVTWEAARQNCRSLGYGVALVSVHNDAENAFLYFYARGQENTQLTHGASFWLGVNDIAVEGSFLNADGSQVDYTKWRHGEPNNVAGNEDCAHGVREELGWVDNACTNTFPYICKIANPWLTHLLGR